jgi:hypothetical protein
MGELNPVSEWDEAYLEQLINLGVQESLTLEFKRSAALGKGDKEKNDISKDVSAFANSAGGVLVYGMIEDKHTASMIDVGVDRNILTKEWLESVIKSRIKPVVESVEIKQVTLPSKGKDMVAYAVEVSPATDRAPHQAFDHRYYKRFNFESTPMEDYEVRDLMRRSIEYQKVFGVAWDLLAEIRRIYSRSVELSKLPSGPYLPRKSLQIAVSDALRTSGVAIITLPKEVRQKTARLINVVDEYNSIVEMADSGQGERARLTDKLRGQLAETIELGNAIASGLTGILKDEP